MKQSDDLKRDLFHIRDILDMMDWLLEEKQNQPYQVKSYTDSLKDAVIELIEHSKAYHKQYDIIELNKMSPDEIKDIADNYQINEFQSKQLVIYEILDKQTK